MARACSPPGPGAPAARGCRSPRRSPRPPPRPGPGSGSRAPRRSRAPGCRARPRPGERSGAPCCRRPRSSGPGPGWAGRSCSASRERMSAGPWVNGRLRRRSRRQCLTRSARRRRSRPARAGRARRRWRCPGRSGGRCPPRGRPPCTTAGPGGRVGDGHHGAERERRAGAGAGAARVVVVGDDPLAAGGRAGSVVGGGGGVVVGGVVVAGGGAVVGVVVAGGGAVVDVAAGTADAVTSADVRAGVARPTPMPCGRRPAATPAGPPWWRWSRSSRHAAAGRPPRRRCPPGSAPAAPPSSAPQRSSAAPCRLPRCIGVLRAPPSVGDGYVSPTSCLLQAADRKTTAEGSGRDRQARGTRRPGSNPGKGPGHRGCALVHRFTSRTRRRRWRWPRPRPPPPSGPWRRRPPPPPGGPGPARLTDPRCGTGARKGESVSTSSRSSGQRTAAPRTSSADLKVTTPLKDSRGPEVQAAPGLGRSPGEAVDHRALGDPGGGQDVEGVVPRLPGVDHQGQVVAGGQLDLGGERLALDRSGASGRSGSRARTRRCPPAPARRPRRSAELGGQQARPAWPPRRGVVGVEPRRWPTADPLGGRR